jgi:Rps23 Pro-64 3,4-dihydroxylase Tpa1-like proline 4-hydroxylase
MSDEITEPDYSVTIDIAPEDDFKIIHSENFSCELDTQIMTAQAEQEVYLTNKIEVMAGYYAGYMKALQDAMKLAEEYSFSFRERALEFKPLDWTNAEIGKYSK